MWKEIHITMIKDKLLQIKYKILKIKNKFITIKEMLINFKKKTTRKKVAISMFTSFVILFVSYLICNTSVPLPNEMSLLQWGDITNYSLHGKKDTIPNEIFLINVSYDKQLVNYVDTDSMTLGNYAITDRQKLYDFLNIAKKENNYKYILLDVFFEKGIVSDQDSILFHLIKSMDRVVIPIHEKKELQDSAILYGKSAIGDHTTTFIETNFVRFKYLHDSVPSIPLKMYQDLNGGNINNFGFLYTSNNWICKNGITLQLPLKINSDSDFTNEERLNSIKDTSVKRAKIFQLGTFLKTNSHYPISNRIKNKIVVIADFKNDKYETYTGSMPGAIILINAYYALQRGDHIILGKYGERFLFYILIAVVYFVTTLCYLNRFSLSSNIRNPWLKLLISFTSVGLLYWIIGVIAYILFDTVYNFWLPIIIFPIIGGIIKIINLYKQIYYEKNKSISHVKSVSDVSDSGKA